MESAFQIITVIVLVFIGAGLFSLLYALSLRMRPQPLASKDFICTGCGHELKAIEIVPFFSFIFLKGRCKSCGEKIPRGEIISELIGGTLLPVLFFRFGKQPLLLNSDPSFSQVMDITTSMSVIKAAALLLWIFFFAMLFLVAVNDMRTMEIPNVLNVLIFLSGICACFVFRDVDLVSHLIGLAVISLPMLLMILIIPGAFGGGDVKLMAGTGLFLGWKLALVAVFFGILTGGIYAIALLAKKKIEKKAHFAFGPFLCFGIALSAFCGSSMLNWYLALGRRLYG